jgi:hypothetical protein
MRVFVGLGWVGSLDVLKIAVRVYKGLSRS